MVVLYFDKENINQCGTNWTWIMPDVKSLNETFIRLRQGVKPPEGTKKIAVLTYPTWEKWQDDTYDSAVEKAVYFQTL